MASAVASTPGPVSVAAAGFDEHAFLTHLATRDEPAWLTERRRAAFDEYQRLLRTPLAQEEWKRVDVRGLQPGKFSVSPSGDAPQQIQTLLENRTEFAGAVSHVDGRRVESRLAASLAARGVLFGSLEEVAKASGELLRSRLFSVVDPRSDRFAAWHAAFLTGGTVLYVPRNVIVDEPLYSLIGLDRAGAADMSHTLIVLEEGAQATLLEETASTRPDTPGLHVGSVELIVGPGARLRYVQLQNWNQQTWHLAHQAGRVERDGSLQWTVAGIGARLAHIHQDVILAGPGASGEVNGATFATDRQVLSYYTQQTHQAPHTHSDLLYKDVLRDEARVIWRGMIRVEPGAQKTDGYQRNDSLLLSPDCRADAIPGLEIEADDVRCTHGATAGRVDADQVFYLMCRGISRYEAMHMIVEGFFHGIYDRIAVEAVRQTLSLAVERKLGIGT
ncbi:MAG: Fe-S cluster assembly protein SufD [Planctomycetaceae bacterium]|nr:MAG: Fe-S cluster assembly protein SufD [Planctomycetaceae bacterium]